MFSLFSRKVRLGESGFFSGFTDWHCHILPGVDDGFKTMEDSLAVLDEYEKAGITTVWLTPHIMEDMPNTTESLKARFVELKSSYQGHIVLHLAAENMLDNVFEKRFRENDLLPMDGQKLLVETSYFTPPMNMIGTLRRIKSAGYFPVLAHPERYVYMDDRYYESLKDLGIIFQLNIGSLVGQFGETARKKAESMLKKGYYGMVGTDLHRRSGWQTLYEGKVKKTADIFNRSEQISK